MGRPNFPTRTVWTGDNLDILRGINSESVDLIYLDPPFNSNRDYAAPIGSEAAGAAFKDTWTLDDVDEAWHGEIADRDPALYSIIDAARLVHGSSMKSYLIMMAVRLLEMRRVLKPTGSIYLHCDPNASHYLKMLMDAVFGKRCFINEIIWCYVDPAGRRNTRYYKKTHDIVFWYVKNRGKYKIRMIARGPLSPSTLGRYEKYFDNSGRLTYRRLKETNPGVFRTLKSVPEDLDQVWLDKAKGTSMSDWWNDITPLKRKGGGQRQQEAVGYPTQKPLKLLQRIIESSSDPGGMVLDPFCGCATGLVPAETLGRRWAGVDLSPLAVKLVGQRLRDQHGLFGQITARDDAPKRTDLGELPNYRTHRHTLYGRQEGICNGCLVLFPFRNLTVDHIVPQSRGGSDHPDNLQLLCGACNSKKGERTMEALIADLLAAQIRPETPYRRTR